MVAASRSIGVNLNDDGTPIKSIFDPANTAIKIKHIVDKVKHRHRGDSGRRDKKCFLPGDNGLAARWMTFLNTYLTDSNSTAIKTGIYAALQDTSLASIQFDCVDGTNAPSGNQQQVFVAQENDYDAEGNVRSTYQKIVLVTPPMPDALAQLGDYHKK